MIREVLAWADPRALTLGAHLAIASLQGAAVFCLVWLACRRGLRLPPAGRSLLWWLVCLKLCLGLIWTHPVSLPWLPAPRTIAPKVIAMPAPTNYAILPTPSAPSHTSPLAPSHLPAQSPVLPSPIPLRQAPIPSMPLMLPVCLLVAWLLSVGLFLARDAYQIGRVVRIARRRTPAPDWLHHEAIPLAYRMGLGRVPSLALSADISAPIVCGLIKPLILLPTDFGEVLTAEERAMALAHEMAHLRRGDLWLSGLLSLTRALFAFHPLAWLAIHECLAAREEACDQAALRLTSGGRARYAGLLLKMAGRGAPRLEAAGAAGFSVAFYSLRSRLLALDTGRPRPRRAKLGIACCLLCALAAIPWRLTAARAATAHLAALAASLSGLHYQLDDIGATDGHGSYAAAINDNGTVVTDVMPAQSGGRTRAFLWNSGQVSPLTRLSTYRHAVATGLNNRGQVIASAYNWSRFHHAFLWDGAPERLPASGSFHFSKALGINDAGQVVGWVQTGRRGRQGMLVARACLWQDGKRHDLGTLGGDYSYAYAINPTGAVVGKADCAPDSVPETHAFLWQSGQMQDLGTLGGRNSVAYSVSPSQQVAGASETSDGTRHAFVWDQGQMRDLGTLPGDVQSVAHSISASGLVVGSSEQANGHLTAVLWANGRIIDLNTLLSPNSGWTLTEARGINARGQIVGEGRWHGQERAFLLTPLHPM